MINLIYNFKHSHLPLNWLLHKLNFRKQWFWVQVPSNGENQCKSHMSYQMLNMCLIKKEKVNELHTTIIKFPSPQFWKPWNNTTLNSLYFCHIIIYLHQKYLCYSLKLLLQDLSLKWKSLCLKFLKHTMKKNTKKKQQQKTQCEYCRIIFIHGGQCLRGAKISLVHGK